MTPEEIQRLNDRLEVAALRERLNTAVLRAEAAEQGIATLEAALAEARKDADYWEAENGRMLELCRTKLGKRDVHGVADGIEQLAALAAEAREDAARLDWLERGENPCVEIHFDDFSMIDTCGLSTRAAIDAARGKT